MSSQQRGKVRLLVVPSGAMTLSPVCDVRLVCDRLMSCSVSPVSVRRAMTPGRRSHALTAVLSSVYSKCADTRRVSKWHQVSTLHFLSNTSAKCGADQTRRYLRNRHSEHVASNFPTGDKSLGQNSLIMSLECTTCCFVGIYSIYLFPCKG